MNRKRQLLSAKLLSQRRAGTLLSYGYIVINCLVVLVYQPIMLRIMGKSEYGLYQLMAQFINYMSVMDMGFGNGIVVFTARYRATGRADSEKKLHGMFRIIFSGIGAVAVALGLFLTWKTQWIFGASLTSDELYKGRILMLILTLNMGVTFPLCIYENIIIAYENFVYTKLIAILRAIMNPLMMLPLLFLGGDSIAMVSVLVGVNITCLVSNCLYCRKKLGVKVSYHGFDKRVFKEIFSYSIFVFLAEIVDKVNWSVDTTILGIVRGTGEVAVYSMAANYNQLVQQLSAAFSSVTLPRITAMASVGASDRQLSDEFIKVSRLQIYCIFLAASGFCMFGRKFVMWHAGVGYATSYAVACILILSSAVPLTQSVALAIIKAKDKFRFRAVLVCCMAAVNVVVSIPLAKLFGSVGSACGTALSLVLANTLVLNIYYKRRCGIDIPRYWRTLLSMSVRFLIPMVPVLALKYLLPVNGIFELAVYGPVYVILYCLVSYYLVMNEYEKSVVHSVAHKLHLIKGKK